MRAYAERSPQGFGLAVTFAGVLVFVPDALVLRLIGADDMMTVAALRGIQAGLIMLIGAAVLAPGVFRDWRACFGGIGLLIAALEGTGMVLFCAAIGSTSVANTLLILATAPFIAALLSWLILGERVSRGTLVAMAVAFLGVVILSAGGGGTASDIGNLYAVGNAFCMAGFYVALRRAGLRNMFPAIGVGYLLGAAVAGALAAPEPLNATQLGWVVLSGAVILPGAIALLSLGPRYLSAPEVSMITLLEVILGPLLVWMVIGEHPGTLSLIGGAAIIAAIGGHALWTYRRDVMRRQVV